MSKRKKINPEDIPVEGDQELPDLPCYCGILIPNHPRCTGCGILCGPNHMTSVVYGYRGESYCPTCLYKHQRADGVEITKVGGEDCII